MFMQRRDKPVFAVASAVIGWVGVIVAIPVILSVYSGNIGQDVVEASPGDSFTFISPIALSRMPLVAVERGTVSAIDTKGKAVSILTVLGGAAGTEGTAHKPHLRLDNARIRIDIGRDRSDGSVETEFGERLGPFVQALAATEYDKLSVRRSVLVIEGLGETIEQIDDVQADIARHGERVTIKGTAIVRGRPLRFEATTLSTALTALAGTERKRGRRPVDFKIEAADAQISFRGELTADDGGLGLLGQGSLAASDGRSLARWFGAYWPSGPGLRDIAVEGQMRLAKQTLSFEQAALSVDGNEGTGAVALRFKAPRPQISGTLAYSTFDLRPYLTQRRQGSSRIPDLSALMADALTVPLGMHLNADLRISADRLQLAGVKLGRLAATITLKDGRLLADLAEVGFDHGVGQGQIGADFTGYVPKVTIRGRLNNTDLGRLSQALAGEPLVETLATLVADLVASGTTMSELLHNLTGKLSIQSNTGGRVGIDLAQLFTAVDGEPGEVMGWGKAVSGRTTFEHLDLELVLKHGVLSAKNCELRSGDVSWVATGMVNLPFRQMDLRVAQQQIMSASANQASPEPQVGSSRQQAALYELRGPWSEPHIQSMSTAVYGDRGE